MRSLPPQGCRTPTYRRAAPTVTRMPGVRAVRFRLTFTVERALPPDAVVLGFLPEWVRAFGLADAFVLVAAGTFLDGLMVTVRPDRGAEPLAPVFGAIAVDPDRCSAR